jgi:hypothetical protein
MNVSVIITAQQSECNDTSPPPQQLVPLFVKSCQKLVDLSGRFMICVWDFPGQLIVAASLMIPSPSGTKFSCQFIAQVIGSKSLKQQV